MVNNFMSTQPDIEDQIDTYDSNKDYIMKNLDDKFYENLVNEVGGGIT